MELIAELDGSRDLRELEEKVNPLKDLYDWIDLPDSPMGSPGPFSILAGCILEERYGVKTIPHLRLADLNMLAVKSIAKTLPLTRIKRLVLLRGDKPRSGSMVEDLTPEEAMAIFRRRNPGIEVGLLLSMRKPWNTILERLEAGPDFILVLNHTMKPLEDLEKLSREARGRGIKVYPYIIVETRRNKELLKGVRGVIGDSMVYSYISRIKGLVDGLLISSPGDHEYLHYIASQISRIH
ncbi:MAG: hypothetical protein GSR86_03485 [Desulfurococcales archaeon]|nr:hypothetical protein [Desulfurococcales archaeon]